MASNRTVKMRVAAGRTIHDCHRTWAEGDEIELPQEEAERLHAAGFLLADGEAASRPSQDSWVTHPDEARRISVGPFTNGGA